MTADRIDIAVTAVGAVTPWGVGWDRTREAIARGECALRTADQFALPIDGQRVATVGDLGAFREAFPGVKPPLPVRETQMVLLAAKEAMDRAKLSPEPPRQDLGVFLDRTFDPAHIGARMADPYVAGGPQKISPIVFAQTVANAAAGTIARLLGARGPNLQTMGGGALYLAVQALRRGEAGAVLAGGFESVQPDHVYAEAKLGRERPFGEGAVVLLLERSDHAASREAAVLAWVRGVSMGIGADECEGRARRDAGLGVGDCQRFDGLRALLGDTLGMSAAASVAWAAAGAEPARTWLVTDESSEGSVFAAVVERCAP